MLIRSGRSALVYCILYIVAAALAVCGLMGLEPNFGAPPTATELPTFAWVFGAIVLVATPLAVLCVHQNRQLGLTQQQLLGQADIDPLTGLLNRPAFFERAEMQLRHSGRSTTCTLMVLDIDHFAEFCESYGDRNADRILQHVAAHLVARVRDNDLFCRMDGDRFAIFLIGANQSQVERLATRMITAIAQRPFSGDGRILEFTASCGFADTRSASDIDALYENAKLALLQAKRSGHNKAVAYDDPAPAAQDSTEAFDVDGPAATET